ncbi:hypothetical protein [Bacillus mojavensis]|uniref:hypothetical protein n=1 Tax=Bacillus mojavensis TaxID=72360 RepID=UPI00227FE6D3|nr:hypothetical protein [Bacillus mojavensis]MCY9191037.1 hypothetical protein [Bacillus mojavensis]
MAPKDWITLVSILVTLVIGITTIVISIRTNKKSRFVNAVTTERVKWMTTLKDLLSEYLSLIAVFYEEDSGNKLEENEKKEYFQKLLYLRNRINLHLNYKGKYDKLINTLVNAINIEIFGYYKAVRYKDVTNHEEVMLKIDRMANLISTISSRYLKKEWERVKEEAEKGNLKKGKKILLTKTKEFFNVR